MRNICFLLIAINFLLSCSKEDKFGEPVIYNIQGKVEKGPFVSGSTITVQELDASMNPTGRTFNETISDNEGNFLMGSTELNSPYALLTSNGYYFNEVEGRLSSGQITLQALADFSDAENVNINMFTHLIKDRVLKLIKENGLSFNDANKQAQKELLTLFGLQAYSSSTVSSFSITLGTNEAGALIAVSSTLLTDKSDAEVTEYMASIRKEFTDNGSLGESAREKLWRNAIKIDWDRIKSNVVDRYKELGKEISVKDLSWFIDWDKDGIAGNELGEEGVTPILKFDIDTLFVPSSGGDHKIKIETNIPISLNPISLEEPPYSIYIPEEFYIYEKDSIGYSRKELTSDNYINISIRPASSRLMEPSEITIYSMDGKRSARLVIVQEGDLTKPVSFTKEGIGALSTLMDRMNNYSSLMYTMEAFYTQCWDHDFPDYFKHRINPSDPYINDLFSESYAIINQLNIFEERSEDRYVISAFRTLKALLYYQMEVLWGNVFYVNSTNWEENWNSRQMEAEELFPLFESDLLYSISTFSKNNWDFTTYNMAFPNEDFPSMILIRIYMHLGKYSQALSLLKDIINKGNYSLESTRQASLKDKSKELIYAYLSESGNQNIFRKVIEANDVIPVFSFTEVLLSIAECEYKLNNISQAVSFLNQVNKVRNIPLAQSSSFLTDLKTAWKSELKGSGTYFPFLKRNGIATSELGIQSYQLLYPIPLSEIMRNPNAKQNPGY
ncbi:RagB/SusD family nutrient uptake outer membrane protein [Parabacteroides sp. Marseille-P3160]|uniref:RagB/SusD family nutrient uptake outer membrane protein n=1 Tax=Parabacteroides sp. Marseille-P3160 TaxID=1917887 RepID=UPI0009BBE435|nr:RagB/SusD family nutrient uptake outer membrane protein [Parabacteroides sp. Marseille-P3160]